MADVYGSDGYDIDEYGNMVPRGTTLNSNPTATATATPGSARRTFDLDAAGRPSCCSRQHHQYAQQFDWPAGCSGSICFTVSAASYANAPWTPNAKLQHRGVKISDPERAQPDDDAWRFADRRVLLALALAHFLPPFRRSQAEQMTEPS